jgi:predicted glycosyltransferase involved in capsule biosynthesis
MKNKKLTIIIPYRDRAEHLEEFLKNGFNNINHDNYDVLIIEQFNENPFNKGLLLNAAFLIKENDSDYFIFHDVDMMPIEIDYSYCEIPTHCVGKIIETPMENYLEAEKKYKIPSQKNFGGVSMFNKADYKKINGFSIEYIGWGAEDHDILLRIKNAKLPYVRRNGIYYNFMHKRPIFDENHQNNLKKLASKYDYNSEGLNNTKYKIINKDYISEKIEHIKIDFI